MELFGRRAWWFPSWLNWLPKLDVEGRGVVESLDAVEAAAVDRAESAEPTESAGA
jgi:RND superfamily putative drug exporter